MTSPDLSLVRSGFTWMFCLRGVMDGTGCLIWSHSPSGKGRDPRGSLTWLFYHIQNGLSTGVFIVLESDDTVILILVGTIHSILASVLWERRKDGRMKNRSVPERWSHPKSSLKTSGKACDRKPYV